MQKNIIMFYLIIKWIGNPVLFELANFLQWICEVKYGQQFLLCKFTWG